MFGRMLGISRGGAGVVLVVFAFVALPAVGVGADWVDKIGRGADVDKAGVAINRQREKITAQEVLRLDRKVRNDELVGLAGALWFERHRASPQESTRILEVLSSRVGHKAMAYAAASPGFLPLAESLVASKRPEVGGRLVATYALMRAEMPEKLRGRGKSVSSDSESDGKKPIGFDVDIFPIVQPLLADRDAEAVEFALLAAGFEADGRYVDAVQPHLEHKSLAVRALAAWYMGRVGRPVDKAVLDNLADRTERDAARSRPSAVPTWDIRGDAVLYSTMALGVSGDGEHQAVLMQRLGSRDLRVAIEAAVGLGRLGEASAVEPMLAVYDTEKTPWPLKVALVDAIGRIPRAESLAQLRERYGREQGRLRLDLLYALNTLSHGQAGPEWTIYAFDDWREANGAAHRPDGARMAAWRASTPIHAMQVNAVGDFYGLSIVSNRPVFVLDTSISMRGDKIEGLKSQLRKTLDFFPGHAKFNIADFGGRINLLQPKMVPSSRATEAYEQWAGYQSDLSLGTRMFDAMELAALVPEMDAAILFTDGVPVGGQFQHAERISAAWKVYTRYCPIMLQGVVFGGKPSGKSVLGMQQLTERFSGTTVHAK